MQQTNSIEPGMLKRVLSSAAIGQFVEWYDYVVYAYTASTIATLFFPNEDHVASLLATFGVFALGFVVRPLGAIFFGHLGDRFGRRNILAIIILTMGAATALIGLLPTYAMVGLVAPALLIVLRLIQGLSAGAETTGSNSLVSEFAPEHKRGFFVSLTYAFANLPAIFTALFVLLLTNFMGEATFSGWGWRVPFWIAGLISLVGLYIRLKLDESPEFIEMKKKAEVVRIPLLTALRDHPRQIFISFVFASLAGLGFYTLVGYFVTYLRETVGLSSNEALISNCIALALAFVTMPLAGMISDRIGRKRVMIIGAVASAILAFPAYILAGDGSLLTAIAGQGILAIALSTYFGPFGVAFLEIFPARVRISGAGLGYNIAYALIGGTAPYVSIWLTSATNNLLAPAGYMVVVSVLVAIVTMFMFDEQEARANYRSKITAGKS